MTPVAPGQIAAALARCATTVLTEAPGRWAMHLGDADTAEARLDGPWLLLGVRALRAAGRDVDDGWGWLRHTASLPGGVAFCHTAGDRMLAARVALALDDDEQLDARLSEAGIGLRAALAHLAGAAPRPRQAGSPPEIDVRALTRETRWPATARTADELAIDLEVPGQFAQATARVDVDRGLVLAVPVLDPASEPAGVCRAALGTFLLRVNAWLRGAHAGVPITGSPEFVAVPGRTPCAAGLDRACAALSVACRFARREAAILARDEVVARTYLAHARQSEEEARP